eukprot:Opistho-2@66625
MGSVRDLESRVIALKLLYLIPSFYAIYFILSAVLCGAFRLDFDGRMPFDFDNFGFGSRRETATWLCMVLTQLLTIALLFVIVRNTGQMWDFVLTLTVLHFTISCIVMQDFPTNWIWWVTIGVSTILVIVFSSLANHYGRDVREIGLDN